MKSETGLLPGWFGDLVFWCKKTNKKTGTAEENNLKMKLKCTIVNMKNVFACTVFKEKLKFAKI